MSLRNITVCAGVSGSGKSTFALRYLVNADLAVRYIFDPAPGEFNPNVGEFSDRLGMRAATDGYELGLALCRGWVIFDPHTLFPGRLKEAFDFFCEWAYETALRIPGQKILVVDEAWLYQTTQGIPLELQTIVQSGRKRGLALMTNLQEPNRLNSSLRNGVSELVCFQLQSDLAVECVEGYGFKPDEVRALAPLEFVAKNLDTGGELRGKIEV
jgi:hypothetical protein